MNLMYLLAPLRNLIQSLPVCLVWFIGIGVAVARRQEHPQLSALAIATFSLLMAMSIVGSILNSILPQMFFDPSSLESLIPVYSLGQIFSTLITAGLWVCVLVAIFGWRKQP